MPTLQSLVFQNLAVACHEDMYFRLGDRAWPELATGEIHFPDGGTLSSDTFFNGVSVGVWRRRCRISTWKLRLVGEGRFVFKLGWHRFEQASVWLAESRVALSGREPVDVDLPQWPDLDDGMLFFRLHAIGPGTVRGGGFHTSDEPLHDVRLGLVITHFNRQRQVVPAIGRIAAEVLDDPALKDRITLTVVDNSRNLQIAPHPGITHIANRNLGGTGGFVRGLLRLIDSRRHTHALFMDDDASCETESIVRSFAMLQFARDPKLSIAGALLRELAPWELLEKGARFDGTVVPLHPGLDMRRVPDLLTAERDTARPQYGAWWFFAFPIAAVRQFPFPFFVRGDDIFFGLGNPFEITTLNGVACLGEDFSSKHGPMTAYLDARYHLVHALLAPGGSAAGVYWVGSRLFVKSLTGYLYTSARAVTLAIRHTLAGPEFFADNLDMQAVRGEIASWVPTEKLVPIDRAPLDLRAGRARRESVLRRFARVFRYRKVLYEHVQTGTGFVAEFDRPRFFRELRDFLGAWLTLFARMPALRREYESGAREMASIEFWRGVYAMPQKRSEEAAPAQVLP